MVRDVAGPAVRAGIDPAGSPADAVVAAAVAEYALVCGREGDADLRQRLLTRLETANDPRRERYLELLSVINGWPAPDSLTPVLDWSVAALRART